MPSITFQEYGDTVKVQDSYVRHTVRIISYETNGNWTSAFCTPNEARKLATMLNEIADRVEDDS